MADVDNGDILRLGARLIYDSLYDVVNVYHVLVDLDVGISWAAAEAYVQSYMDDLYDNIKTPLSDTMTTGNISVSNVTQATTLGAISWSPGWAGAESGEPTSSGVCLFTWARTYKPRVQIRKYFGVFGEVNVVAGSWTATAYNACEALMEDHIDTIVVSGVKTFQGVAYNRTLDTYEMGVSVASSVEPAYQRRRKRGRGS